MNFFALILGLCALPALGKPLLAIEVLPPKGIVAIARGTVEILEDARGQATAVKVVFKPGNTFKKTGKFTKLDKVIKVADLVGKHPIEFRQQVLGQLSLPDWNPKTGGTFNLQLVQPGGSETIHITIKLLRGPEGWVAVNDKNAIKTVASIRVDDKSHRVLKCELF